MKLTIHRGTREIGGSCVEITTGSTRLVIDLGLPLVNADREPFDSRAALLKTNHELQVEGTIPNVPGLFDEEYPAPDGVLLSHAHLDHAGLLPRSRSSVPIYATLGTSKMMLAAGVFAGQKELPRHRFREMVNRQSLTVGDCRITPLAVDHSIFGSTAFLIEAEGKRVLYSGDFRNHGRKPGMMRDLIHALQEIKINVLIVEGTHLGGDRDQGQSEYQLEVEITALITAAPALVLATFSALDVDRLVTVYKASQASGRVLVLDAYAAFVLYLIGKQAQVPQARRALGIRVFFNELFLRRKLETIESKFRSERIELTEILAEQNKYVLCFRPSMTKFDFQGKLPDQCRCLYGFWKGYLTKPDWLELRQHIELVRGDFIPAHVSGHAYITDLFQFVSSVQADIVIPIHSFEPQLYREQFSNVVLLQDGIPLELP